MKDTGKRKIYLKRDKTTNVDFYKWSSMQSQMGGAGALAPPLAGAPVPPLAGAPASPRTRRLTSEHSA